MLLFWMLSLFPERENVVELSYSSGQAKGFPAWSHGNSPDETSTFNMQVQAQRKELPFGKCFLHSEAGD